MKFGLDR